MDTFPLCGTACSWEIERVRVQHGKCRRSKNRGGRHEAPVTTTQHDVIIIGSGIYAIAAAKFVREQVGVHNRVGAAV